MPMVTPTTDVPIQVDRVPSQQGTDLTYIRELATRNGFVFYIEPTAVPGVNTAYWGLDNRLGIPQPALTMNMGADTNVDDPISFSYDALGPAQPQVTIVEPFTKMSIAIPVPSGLTPPLSLRPAAQSLRTTLPRDSSNLNPVQAGLRAASSASQSSDAVTGTGEVDAVRYGQVLRARKLVGVRGVGFQLRRQLLRARGHPPHPARRIQAVVLDHARRPWRLASAGAAMSGPMFGKFRGVVSDNRDPLMLGRIRAKVVDVFGDNESGWALLKRCRMRARTWGCSWFRRPTLSCGSNSSTGTRSIRSGPAASGRRAEVLSLMPTVSEMKVLKTDLVTVTINDLPGAGGLTIETTQGMKIKISSTGIEIDNGMGASIKLSGPQTSINGSALEVT
ncbi:phage baseplate assembly protein V [Massilia sp. H-1]|nr:phage baseplate assembly protein V [Massilia sp. H-1]